MSNEALNKILESKNEHIANLKDKYAGKFDRSLRQHGMLDLESAIQEPGMQVIAEVKNSSPSMGKIYPGENFDPVELAMSYEANGACAISVLTEELLFKGSLDYLGAVKDAVEIPVLRKDFLTTKEEVYESLLIGADAILLIADILKEGQLEELHSFAEDLGLGVLVEFHDSSQLERIRKLNPEIIGVNCRDLKKMETNFEVFEALIDELPRSARVAESGIDSPEHLRQVMELGFDGALIGTSFMRHNNPGAVLADFLDEVGR